MHLERASQSSHCRKIFRNYGGKSCGTFGRNLIDPRLYSWWKNKDLTHNPKDMKTRILLVTNQLYDIV